MCKQSQLITVKLGCFGQKNHYLFKKKNICVIDYHLKKCVLLIVIKKKKNRFIGYYLKTKTETTHIRMGMTSS